MKNEPAKEDKLVDGTRYIVTRKGRECILVWHSGYEVFYRESCVDDLEDGNTWEPRYVTWVRLPCLKALKKLVLESRSTSRSATKRSAK